jgi:hypothetical protein
MNKVDPEQVISLLLQLPAFKRILLHQVQPPRTNTLETVCIRISTITVPLLVTSSYLNPSSRLPFTDIDDLNVKHSSWHSVWMMVTRIGRATFAQPIISQFILQNNLYNTGEKVALLGMIVH